MPNDGASIGMAHTAVPDIPLPAEVPAGLPAQYYRTIDVKYWLLALTAGAAIWGLLFAYFTR